MWISSVEQQSRPGAASLAALVEQHRQCSRRLEMLLAERYLSESERKEVAELKKRKLQLKDEMERFARPAAQSRIDAGVPSALPAR